MNPHKGRETVSAKDPRQNDSKNVERSQAGKSGFRKLESSMLFECV